MAEQSIKFKLVVENGQAFAVFEQADKLEQKQALNAQLIKEEYADTYNQITAELMKYDSFTQENISTLAKWIQTQGFSSKAIEEVIYALEKENQTVAINSKAYIDNQKRIGALRGSYSTLLSGQQNVAQGSNITNMAIQQLGYAMGDASTFAFSFRTGLMAIGNNIPMIVQYFIMARMEAIKLGTTLKAELLSSLFGAGGLILGINILMTALTILPGLFDDAEKESDEFSDSLDDQSNSLQAVINKLREYKVALDEAGKIEQRIKKEKYGTRLEELKTQLTEVTLASYRYAGQTVKDESVVKYYEQRIKSLKDEIGKLTNIMNGSTPEFSKYTEGIYKIARAAQEYSGDTLTEWMKNENLTSNQIKQTINSLKEANGTLEFGSVKYQLNIKTVDNLEKAYSSYNNSLKKSDDSKKKYLVTTDKEIKLDIEKLKTQYELAKSDSERLRIIDEIISKQNQLNRSTNDFIEAIKKVSARGFEDNTNLTPHVDTKTKNVQKSNPVNESTNYLRTQIFLAETLKQSFNEAGSAITNAGASSVVAFKQANSILQIFINSLIQAATRALILKGITSVFGLIGGPIGAIAGVASAEGNIFTRPTLSMIGEAGPEAVIPLSKLQDVTLPFSQNSGAQSFSTKKLESLMNEYFNKIDNWQRELSFKINGIDLTTNRQLADNIYNKFKIK